MFNYLMQRQLKKEAKRLAKEALESFSELRTRKESIQEIILEKVMEEEGLTKISESSRERIKTCCKTVNGFCYMMALDTGPLKKLINIRSLQFTEYMDEELKKLGFPDQTTEQKKEILEAMELGPSFSRYLELKNAKDKN